MTSFYQAQAARHIKINETDNGQLFCTIPSEQDINVRYKLECVESATTVEVLSCNCKGHKRYGHCKHVEIVQSFWANLYQHNTDENTQEYQKRIVEVEVVETPVVVLPQCSKVAVLLDQVVEAEKVTDLSKKGDLGGTKKYSLLR